MMGEYEAELQPALPIDSLLDTIMKSFFLKLF
jgi:hypothetical protein